LPRFGSALLLGDSPCFLRYKIVASFHCIFFLGFLSLKHPIQSFCHCTSIPSFLL
jgi:hypothetical protein